MKIRNKNDYNRNSLDLVSLSPENLLVLSCPNKQHSFEPFMCLDAVL